MSEEICAKLLTVPAAMHYSVVKEQ